MSESLYGVKDPSKTKHKPISTTTSLNFSSNLSALISSSTTSKSAIPSTAARPRPSKSSKSDIFNSHNKNVKKRSAADMEPSQSHQTKHDIGSVSTSEHHHSKRKMEEKVRLYNAMKRGEYIGRSDYDDRGLVDFDQKWAASQAGKTRDSASEQDSDSDGDSTHEEQETVSYLDEFGRLRTGTASMARRHERTQRIAAAAANETVNQSAHPERPSNIIYGDAIQHQAFNPDTITSQKINELVSKRDRSATPPPETHYDASHEIRTRGTGFYGFSKDQELRKEEMDALEKERRETEKARLEKEEGKMKRKREIEERRKVLAKKRSEREADRFLEGLELNLPGGGGS